MSHKIIAYVDQISIFWSTGFSTPRINIKGSVWILYGQELKLSISFYISKLINVVGCSGNKCFAIVFLLFGCEKDEEYPHFWPTSTFGKTAKLSKMKKKMIVFNILLCLIMYVTTSCVHSQYSIFCAKFYLVKTVPL